MPMLPILYGRSRRSRGAMSKRGRLALIKARHLLMSDAASADVDDSLLEDHEHVHAEPQTPGSPTRWLREQGG